MNGPKKKIINALKEAISFYLQPIRCGMVMFIAFLCLFIPCQQQLAAQETYDTPWKWTHFTTSSGLPSDHAYSIIFSSSGTPWVSTARGTAWYDGYRWIPVGESQGLPCTKFAVESFGNDSILISSQEGFFIGGKDGFHKICDTRMRWAAPFTRHSILFVDPSGALELYANNQFHELANFSKEKFGMPLKLWPVADSIVWLYTSKGLYRYEKGKWSCKFFPSSINFDIKAVVERPVGDAFFAITSPFSQRGVWEWTQDGRTKRITREGFDQIYNFDVNVHGEIIVLDLSGGIQDYSQKRWRAISSIPAAIKNIEGFQFAPNGDLWVCCESGLHLYKSSSKRWRYISHPGSDPRNRINGIAISSKGDLWLGTGKGLEIHKKNGEIRYVENINGQPLHDVTGLAEDKNGNVWISSGSSFDGAYQWNGRSWKHFPIFNESDGMRIHNIKIDRSGTPWFLGMSKFGFSLIYNEPGAARLCNDSVEIWDKKRHPFLGRMYSFGEGNYGEYWFASNYGLIRYKDGSWMEWPSNKLYRCVVFALAIDSHNNVWYCDRMNGIRCIDNHFRDTVFTINDGLISNEVWGIAFGAHDEVWAATWKGLSCYANGTWSNFGETEGLSKTQLWPIVVRDSQVYVGTIGRGLAILNLREGHSPPPIVTPPKVLVEREHALVRWTPFSFWEELPSAEIQTRYRLNDSAWSRWSNLHEVTLNNLSPGNYRFQVQAKGLFGNFDSTGQIASFTISPPFYLQPGFILPVGGLVIFALVLVIRSIERKRRHNRELRLSEMKFRRLTEATFEGILLHQDGVIIDVNESVKRIFGYLTDDLIGRSIVDLVPPPEQQRMAEQLLKDHAADFDKPFEITGVRRDGTAIVLEIITKTLPSSNGKVIHVAAIRDISERKEAERQLLDYQNRLRSLATELSLTEEQERRRMATYLHDSIGQTLAFCRIKLGMLREAISPGTRLEQDWNDLRQTLDQSILDTRSLTFELSPPVLHELSIIDAFEWLIEQLTRLHPMSITVEGHNPSLPLAADLKAFLFRSVRELIINAAKHANAAHVFIRTHEADGLYSVDVEDDGAGFDVPETGLPQSQGFGLFSIRERLQYLGGSLQIFSQPGKGTRIALQVPLSARKTPT